MTIPRVIAGLIGVVLILCAVVLAFAWTMCRVYVKSDECLVLVRKSGQPLPPGQRIAEAGQKGIQREALGPGRYFFLPWKWEWEKHDLVEIAAGDPATWREVWATGDPDYNIPSTEGKWPEVGIVTSLAGKPWDQPAEVVDEGYQGIRRRVLTPGTYRLNPRAYKVETVPAVVVPLGCVGVVTSQLGDMPGTETIEEVSIGPDGEPVKGRGKVVQKLAEEGQRRAEKRPATRYLLHQSEGLPGQDRPDRIQPDIALADSGPQRQHLLPVRRRLHDRGRGDGRVGASSHAHA